MCVPSAAEMSCAVTRMRSPERRTLPSRTFVTPSACAMRRTSSFLPLNANADVRAMTFSPGICASALMISSARPSLKYSFSLSPLRLANGSTAIDGWRSRRPERGLLERRPDLGHRLIAVGRGASRGIASRRARARAARRRAPADRRAGSRVITCDVVWPANGRRPLTIS